MEIGNSIRRKGKQEVVIQSIIWNTIIGVFKEKKDMDITSYLISIKLKGNTVLVKTLKPIVNTELYNMSNNIITESEKKIKALGLSFPKFDIKFL